MRWCKKVVEGTSVPLWCFCRKAQDTLAFTTRSQQLRSCQVTAGARLSMANKSHGGAAGGRIGSKNIEEAVEKRAELQVYFFEKMKGKGKVENFSTAGAEAFAQRTDFSQKRWIQRVPGIQKCHHCRVAMNCLWRNVEMAHRNTQEKSTVYVPCMAWWGGSGILGFLRRLRQLTESRGCMACKERAMHIRRWRVDISKWVETWSLRLCHYVSPTN